MFRISQIMLICLFLITAGHVNILTQASENEENIPEWGVYVYMAGDNSLTDEVEDDLNEMKLVGSNDNREIVVLSDQINSDDSHAYHVIKDGVEEKQLNQINDTWENELNMGDKNTLRDFMIWASTEYPVQKTILIIWNHGSGWEKVAEDKNDFLTVPEIRMAIEEYRTITENPKLTLLGFDACLMGMFEIAYELKDEAEMVHGSEAYEPLAGWTYNHLLYKLKPGLTNYELAEHVVNDYIESYRNGSVYTGYSVTSAVVETNKLEDLWNELDNLSSELISIKPMYQNETAISRNNTQRYDQNPNYRDLYDLTVNLKENIPVYDLHEAANRLQHILNQSIIAEDHWRKPGKLAVDRAHGLTIYFPTEGAEEGYSNLKIANNRWYEFIELYPNNVINSANIEEINITSVDTGTGYNDSVHINGSYSGEIEKIKIRMINYQGETTNLYEGNISNGKVPDIFLQPTKSGYYNVELGLYGFEGYLEEHYIIENLYVDLRLPDLYVSKPKILITDQNNNLHSVNHLQKDDPFIISGEITNQGTINADNVSVLVENGGTSYSFNLSKIEPNETKIWNISNTEDMKIAGAYKLNIEVMFDNEYEIDASNNKIELNFNVFEKIAHDYSITSKNKNIIELQSEKEYEFTWLESYLTFTNTKEQSWDNITITSALPQDWEIEVNEFLHLSETTEILIKIKAPIRTNVGEYNIVITANDRNGFFAGNGTITVNVPQYYGVKLSAKQIDNYAEITIENNGNGNDYFVLNKELEEGLKLYLPETRFQLEGFEIKTIKTVGLETEESKTYDATFVIKSEGNSNISASIKLPMSKIHLEETNNYNIQNIIIAFIGLIGISYIIYQRKIN